MEYDILIIFKNLYTPHPKEDQMNNSMGSSPIFYENGSWYHRTKNLTESLQIEYGKRGGYETEDEAAEAYVEHLNIFKNRLALLKEKQTPQFSFKDYLIYWHHNIYTPRSDDSTKVVASYVLYNFILPSLTLQEEEIPLSALTVSTLNSLMKRTDKYCKTSAKQTHKYLSAVFLDAHLDGHVKENPMDYADKYYWEDPKPAVIYTKEQLKTFLFYVSHFYRQLYLEFILALFCGLRSGEIRGLQFEDTNKIQQTLHVQRQITAKYTLIYSTSGVKAVRNGRAVKPPKSDSSLRLLKIHRFVFELLNERREEIRKLKKNHKETWNHEYDGYICIGKNGNIKSECTFNAALERICTRIGLPVISMHDLRHMCATWLFYSGVDLLRVSLFLGHKNPNTTFDIYISHLEGSEHLRGVLDATFNPFPELPQVSEPVGRAV